MPISWRCIKTRRRFVTWHRNFGFDAEERGGRGRSVVRSTTRKFSWGVWWWARREDGGKNLNRRLQPTRTCRSFTGIEKDGKQATSRLIVAFSSFLPLGRGVDVTIIIPRRKMRLAKPQISAKRASRKVMQICITSSCLCGGDAISFSRARRRRRLWESQTRPYSVFGPFYYALERPRFLRFHRKGLSKKFYTHILTSSYIEKYQTFQRDSDDPFLRATLLHARY